jgi:hypothetical protein
MEKPWDLKIQRARTQVAEFNTIVVDYLATNPAGISQELLNGNEIHVKLHIHRQPPDVLAVLSGEIIHNLRSALDAVTFALVIEKTRILGVPQKDGYENLIQFPIVVKKRSLSEYKFLKHFKKESFYADLQEFQPYNWSKEFVPDNQRVEVNKGHHLALLSELSNRDKHRGINFIFCALRNFMVTCPDGVTTDGKFTYSAVFKNNEKILNFNLVGNGDYSQVNVIPEFSLSYVPSEYGFKNDSVQNQLSTLLNQSAYYVNQLAFHLEKNS